MNQIRIEKRLIAAEIIQKRIEQRLIAAECSHKLATATIPEQDADENWHNILLACLILGIVFYCYATARTTEKKIIRSNRILIASLVRLHNIRDELTKLIHAALEEGQQPGPAIPHGF